jgi:hypothetical protein
LDHRLHGRDGERESGPSTESALSADEADLETRARLHGDLDGKEALDWEIHVPEPQSRHAEQARSRQLDGLADDKQPRTHPTREHRHEMIVEGRAFH